MSTEMELLFYVIELIDSKTIMINFGIDDGATVGEKIRIIDKESIEKVVDPITNENLGEFYIIKAELEIVTIYDGFSICQNLSNVENYTLRAFNNISNLLYSDKQINDLNLDVSKLTNRKVTTVEPIRLYDPVMISI